MWHFVGVFFSAHSVYRSQNVFSHSRLFLEPCASTLSATQNWSQIPCICAHTLCWWSWFWFTAHTAAEWLKACILFQESYVDLCFDWRWWTLIVCPLVVLEKNSLAHNLLCIVCEHYWNHHMTFLKACKIVLWPLTNVLYIYIYIYPSQKANSCKIKKFLKKKERKKCCDFFFFFMQIAWR